MPSVTIGEDFKTGHAIVDHQHQELIGMLMELHAAMHSDESAIILDPIFSRFAKSLAEHFVTEENLMRARKYPGLSVHRETHKELTRKSIDIIDRYKTDKTIASANIGQFLVDWVKHHIQIEDKAMAKWLKDHP
jgi:hemerythrin-like metal-binding protein